MDLLLNRSWHNRKQLEQLIRDLARANPGAKWTRQVERMGVDDKGNVVGDMWYRAEVYKLGGLPIFEVVMRSGGNEAWNDLRPVLQQA